MCASHMKENAKEDAMATGKKRDVKKERYWRGVIREAARGGTSIREFCRARRLKESQFYWWQRALKQRGRERSAAQAADNGSEASFALVSTESGSMEAGLELVLTDGRRLRIGKGVDAETLRAVLAEVGS